MCTPTICTKIFAKYIKIIKLSLFEPPNTSEWAYFEFGSFINSSNSSELKSS